MIDGVVADKVSSSRMDAGESNSIQRFSNPYPRNPSHRSNSCRGGSQNRREPKAKSEEEGVEPELDEVWYCQEDSWDDNNVKIHRR